jgi:hypothetical protein
LRGKRRRETDRQTDRQTEREAQRAYRSEEDVVQQSVFVVQYKKESIPHDLFEYSN